VSPPLCMLPAHRFQCTVGPMTSILGFSISSEEGVFPGPFFSLSLSISSLFPFLGLPYAPFCLFCIRRSWISYRGVGAAPFVSSYFKSRGSRWSFLIPVSVPLGFFFLFWLFFFQMIFSSSAGTALLFDAVQSFPSSHFLPWYFFLL